MRDTGKRFEIDISGHTVFATYRLEGKTLFIDHVEAPPPCAAPARPAH